MPKSKNWIKMGLFNNRKEDKKTEITIPEKRKVVVSNSTAASLRITEEILKVIFKNAPFNIFHATVDFTDLGLQPWSNYHRSQKVEMKICVSFNPTRSDSWDFSLRFEIDDNPEPVGWKLKGKSKVLVKPRSQELIELYGDDYGVICNSPPANEEKFKEISEFFQKADRATGYY